MPEGVAAAMAGAEGGGAYLVHAGKRSQVPRGGVWLFVFAYLETR